ncbi:rab-GTPase-TBC domain-containing protein [Dichotomocladium elegans]|nr:rab-GTPase-TBC domain-containing protein [Dichotomocladium elegans]
MATDYDAFTLPTSVDSFSSSFWETLKETTYFGLQRNKFGRASLMRNFFGTVQNVLDTRQSQYRILYRRAANTVNHHRQGSKKNYASCYQIAASDSEKQSLMAWAWIETHLSPSLEMLDPMEKDDYVVTKLNFIVTQRDAGTDEVSMDERVRNGSRSFRQTFGVPITERLVNYYSCGYATNWFASQGWLYMSENYVAFYSYLMGYETKLLVEHKEVRAITKEKSGVFSDAIRVVMKDQSEHLFSGFVDRDIVYDELMQLTGLAMQRVLKNSALEQHLHWTNGSSSSLMETSSGNGDTSSSCATPPGNSSMNHHGTTPSLKMDLETQRRNEQFQAQFHLPSTEELLLHVSATQFNNSSRPIHGQICLSQAFLTFHAFEQLYQAVIPLCTIRRIERLFDLNYMLSIKIVNCHQKTIKFCFDNITKQEYEEIIYHLTQQLAKQHQTIGHSLNDFMIQCPSELVVNNCSNDDIDRSGAGGLGLLFGFPGDEIKLKDKAKMKLWKRYYSEYGRNLTLIKTQEFSRLCHVGLPNRLRGEVWEICAGSVYQRLLSQGSYWRILEENKHRTSYSIEEIEKDVTRSLPEYPAYQTSQGIERLRRVLTAYSWKDPELGYCQAMNLVASALLIYMNEEQAFHILDTLCNEMLPGYYSTSMYGAQLDMVIFEHLIEETMPALHQHIQKTGLQISVACLPWFLTLYLNAVPLVYAFRMMDCLFMDGPKILFQIGLPILKLNSERILQVGDDGSFIQILKSYLQSLGEPVHPVAPRDGREKTLTVSKRVGGEEESENSMKPCFSHQAQKFNELMRTAYTEFADITDTRVRELRQTHQFKVVAGIESTAKRSAIRNLDNDGGFTVEELESICDHYHDVQYYAMDKDRASGMDFKCFEMFMGKLVDWAKVQPCEEERRNKVGKTFLVRLFSKLFDRHEQGSVTFQDAVIGLARLTKGDHNDQIRLFVELHDLDEDGYFNRDELLQFSESLLWILRDKHDDEGYLDSVSTFLREAFLYSETRADPHESYLSIASLRFAITFSALYVCLALVPTDVVECLCLATRCFAIFSPADLVRLSEL